MEEKQNLVFSCCDHGNLYGGCESCRDSAGCSTCLINEPFLRGIEPNDPFLFVTEKPPARSDPLLRERVGGGVTMDLREAGIFGYRCNDPLLRVHLYWLSWLQLFFLNLKPIPPMKRKMSLFLMIIYSLWPEMTYMVL